MYAGDSYPEQRAAAHPDQQRAAPHHEQQRAAAGGARAGGYAQPAPGHAGEMIHRTSSVSDYFRRPVNLNASMQSSLIDEISDEWETRSEVAKL